MIRIHREFSNEVNAITHPAPHHADEVFATAMLANLFQVEVFRTRDQGIIANVSDAIVYDVGGEFDAKERRFDHHQKGFSEMRPDGTLFASAGLIWREFGAEIVREITSIELEDEAIFEVVSRVDDALIRGIDARDNGQELDGKQFSVSSVISSFNPLWDGDEDENECFLKACEMASSILEREIIAVSSSVHGQEVVKELIESADDAILVMDQFIGGWLEAVLESKDNKAADLVYAVFPTRDGNWGIKAVPPSKEEIKGQRKPFPEEWRGLKGEEFAEVSGVETAVFCHNAGFFAVAKAREAAVKLARRAVEY